MREIKFKAWDNDKKQIAKVFAIDWVTDGNIISTHLEYKDGSIEKKYPDKDYGDDIELLQYTGLKDKNGKEIYEGDIYKSSEGLIHQVVWNDNGFKSLYISYRIYQGEKYTEEVYGNLGDTESRRWGIEVIGNIYENPELLEVK